MLVRAPNNSLSPTMHSHPQMYLQVPIGPGMEERERERIPHLCIYEPVDKVEHRAMMLSSNRIAESDTFFHN